MCTAGDICHWWSLQDGEAYCHVWAGPGMGVTEILEKEMGSTPGQEACGIQVEPIGPGRMMILLS